LKFVRQIIDSPNAPPSLRSYSDLRSAQSYAAEGKSDLAKAEYARIATNTAYPLVHRGEASECESELERNARGLPSRAPAASRTKLTRVQFAARVFVSPEGSDSNDGAATSPVATLSRARDRVRAMKAAGTIGAIRRRDPAGRVPGPASATCQNSGCVTLPGT
jgi:hypothetical protein